MREIILDTETTGLDPATGDRVVEIGAVELLNGSQSGKVYHAYINPERDVPEGAVKVHGLTAEFLSAYPVFARIADEFLKFIGEDRLVIHNAEFDVKFLNAELARLNHPPISFDRVLDTLPLARRKHPGQSNTLDALCERYGVDSSRREKHGALLDAELLAEVYIELSGGRQKSLELPTQTAVAVRAQMNLDTTRRAPLHRLTAAEERAHAHFMEGFGDKAVWSRYRAKLAGEA